MENQRYMQEGLDWKRLLLLTRKKIWMPAAAAAAGALLGGGIYLLLHLVLLPEREYQSVGKFYLDFNCDPEDYNQLSYNGYTWNDLMDTDPILDYTMELLPPEVDRQTVAAATRAEILSDIRLLTVTVTAPAPELAELIMEATGASLVHLGETDGLFRSIRIYGITEAAQILWDNRTWSAVVTGAVLALFVSVMALAFYYVLDDSVYVERDVERRYGITAMGVLAAGGPATETGSAGIFYANYSYLCRGLGEVAFLSADSREDAERAEQAVGNQEQPQRLAAGMPQTEEDYRRLREKDGVILAIRYGGRNGRAVERLLDQLRRQDCTVLGAVIVEADRQFLKRYYGRKERTEG
ncbi:MAG: hypothetical protein ACI4D5_00020 [Kineothrix sp.]